MCTASNNPLSGYEIIARTSIKQQNIILCKSNASKNYLTAELDRNTRTLQSQRTFADPFAAYQDYFTRIAAPLTLDRQSLSLLLVTPEPERLETTFGKNANHQPRKKQPVQQGRSMSSQCNRETIDRSLTPASFFTPGKVPQWLEATRSTMLLSSGIAIIQGTQYKIIAMNLKPNAKETESIIHLETPSGQRADISLAVACSCFCKSTEPKELIQNKTPGR